jgi:DNA (cytosine-5)-methyltransferase 1
LKVIDLFSGCGGLSLGFQNAGFEIVAAFDNWKPAIEVYEKNFKHPIYDVDLSNYNDIDFLAYLDSSIIIGGPPCQDFSSAGKRDENAGRADLTISFAKIVCSVKPQYFVMENVDRITKSSTFKKVIEIFKSNQYALSSNTLDACFCGVPQKRKRHFLVGALNGQPDFMNFFYKNNMKSKPMTIYDYLGNSLNTTYYYRHPRSYQRRAIFSIYEPSPTIRGVNRPIPKNYKFHKGDPITNYDEVRALTTIERSYIQTFPESFKWFGNKTELEQMIGNAVPVKLSEFIAKSLLDYIDFKNQELTLFQPKKLG